MLPIVQDAPQTVIVEAVRSLGGGGGGGGNSDSLNIIKVSFAHNTSGILTGASLYTPAVGDVIYDWWVEIDTAWNGQTPSFDLGTLTSGGNGLLLANDLPAMSLATADAALTGNAGLLANPNPLSWSAAVASGAFVAATPVGRAPFIVTAANPLKGIVSQDGFAGTPVAASVGTGTASSSPLTVTTGTNDTFLYVGPSGTPETFTVAAGTYSSHGAIVVAMNAATGSVSAEAFDTIATATQNILGQMTVTMNVAGAFNNGNTVQAGPNDFLASTGLVDGQFMEGGRGGDPGSTQGAAKLCILTGSP